jgi:hypothetical protein
LRLPPRLRTSFFVSDDHSLAIEATATRNVHADHLKGIRELANEHRIGRRIVVSLDERERRTDDGIEILPALTFARLLWADELVRSRRVAIAPSRQLTILPHPAATTISPAAVVAT